MRHYTYILSLFGFLLLPGAAYAACGGGPSCPPGYSCAMVPIDEFTSIEACINDSTGDPDGPPDPAPEMSVMMLPVAIGAAGFFAVRSRRKARRKKKAE